MFQFRYDSVDAYLIRGSFYICENNNLDILNRDPASKYS